MRTFVKALCNVVAAILVAPMTCLCWLEQRLSKDSSAVFDLFAHAISLVPGTPGVFLRRAFYRATLDHCSADCAISFGAFFSRRSARVECGVYIGPYAIIGSAWLERGCLIGSRASLLSGGQLHHRENGKWGPVDFTQEVQIRIGEGVWLGEGVIVMADVGRGAMIAAGSVVSSAVQPHVMVAGNPARFVRRLDVPDAESEGSARLTVTVPTEGDA